MENVIIVAIVFAVPILAIIGWIILSGIKILKGGISRKDQKFQNDEARIIQEIYQGISRMEERVDALETIIMERERKDHKR
jgi:phage shock protein B